MSGSNLMLTEEEDENGFETKIGNGPGFVQDRLHQHMVMAVKKGFQGTL
jgi:hypothetical protein